jgi:hypothetical protein
VVVEVVHREPNLHPEQRVPFVPFEDNKCIIQIVRKLVPKEHHDIVESDPPSE